MVREEFIRHAKPDSTPGDAGSLTPFPPLNTVLILPDGERDEEPDHERDL